MKNCFISMLIFLLCTLSASAAEMSVSGNAVTVSGAPDNSTLIAAFYKDGILSGTKISKGSGTITMDISEGSTGADKIKAFLWDMDTIQPLDDAADITSETASDETSEPTSDIEEVFDKVYITANNVTFTATLADNSSAAAFVELLKDGDITIEMSDYGNFEKVGSLGTTLPRNDEQITTEAGDLILYQGNSITIYYDTNSWNFTRLGKIENVTGEELKAALGSGDVTVTFSLYQ
ncbi:MAG: hypothetical protein LIO53_01115 [Oscillospiraceae bacterium]|nr:hypothetical protein [Oscillospiraceae bacterium]